MIDGAVALVKGLRELTKPAEQTRGEAEITRLAAQYRPLAGHPGPWICLGAFAIIVIASLAER